MSPVNSPVPHIHVRSIECCESPLGPLITAATAEAVCSLQFCEPTDLEAALSALRRTHAASLVAGSNAHLARLHAQLAQYFAGLRRTFDVPLVYGGSPFQRQVWAMLLRIPYGAAWSYLEVAKRLGDAQATRAVGAANGANPIAIVIPCHRVVNADGKLGGYGGGFWRKRFLLDLELGQGALGL
ncbi:MAG TPA: methylated-DNA--[protein]-cysteine S-methyltransferase [Steroidobacter sp.]|jgi:O-6-methylguanine DNA methyltransferase|nr:methylated-DNA--[protein]-cysteine S-methyltransferase [Steroidobacter sp.]